MSQPTVLQRKESQHSITILKDMLEDAPQYGDNRGVRMVFVIIRKTTAKYRFVDVFTMHEGIMHLITSRLSAAAFLTLVTSNGELTIRLERGGSSAADEIANTLEAITGYKVSAVVL